jgi:N-acetylglutamate synthase-like GNAT family acetyltransferase
MELCCRELDLKYQNIFAISRLHLWEIALGCGALHFYTPTSGEVRSLAVDPLLKTRGVGRCIV